MGCEITLSVNRNGITEKIYLGTSENPISSFNDIKKLLDKLDKSELEAIFDTIPSIQQVEDLNIADISENSVGVFTPAELAEDIPKYKNTILKLKLTKDTWKKNIVIAGFGSPSIKTQYINEHIFLNLNYMYNDDNKALALFEAALYTVNPDGYKIAISTLLNPNIDESVKINIIKSAFKSRANSTDWNSIKSIYDFIIINKQIEDKSKDILLNTRDSVSVLLETFTELVTTTNRDKNYTPGENTNIQSLKQGDLIKVKFNNLTKYEIFYDYFVDQNGDIIVKTISPGSSKVNNRLFPGNKVEAKRYNNIIYTPSSKLIGVTIPVTEKNFSINHNSLYDLIKYFGIKVKDKTIKSIQGSTITFESGEEVLLNSIKSITINKSEMSFRSGTLEDFPESILKQSFIKTIPTHSKILLEVTNGINITYKEALIIAKGTSKSINAEELVYITDNGLGKNIEGKILTNAVKYLLPDNNSIITSSEINEIQPIITQLYNSNNLNEFIAPKRKRLLDFGYSIEKVSTYTNFIKGDILYNYNTDQYMKIVDDNGKFPLVSTLLNGQIIYISLLPENLENVILLTKTPVNSTFALNYSIKNGYKIDTVSNPNEVMKFKRGQINVETIAYIFKKANGFIYSMSSLEMTNVKKGIPHSVYTSVDLDITSDYRKFIASRFDKNILSTDRLYRYKYALNDNYLHDQFNTTWFDIKNKDISNLVKYITPGSFITFSKPDKTGNSKAFIIEKVIDKQLLISAYHYTNSPDVKKGINIGNVISEKMLIDVDQISMEPSALFIPNWANKNITALQKILFPIEEKNTLPSKFEKEDSAEVINNLCAFLVEKYGVVINFVNNFQVAQVAGTSETTAAFVYNGEIYINTDKATIEEPLHEFLHLVLMTLKSNNPDNYYTLVRSVESHPLFKQTSRLYEGEINIEILEETFIKLLTSTFKHRIKNEGIFSEEIFNKTINESIQELLHLEESIEEEDTMDLLTNPIGEIMTMFGTSLMGEPEGLIDNKSILKMLEYSSVIKDLLEEGNLIEDCG